MRASVRLSVLILVLTVIWSCGTARRDVELRRDFTLQPGMKIRVQDVSNETGEIFDVDVIGLFWDALEKNLREANLLWVRGMRVRPLELHARIVEYKKGNALQRWTMPGLGSTVLNASADLRNGNETVASVDVYRKVAIGDGLTTIGAWQKVFDKAAEDILEALRAEAGGSEEN